MARECFYIIAVILADWTLGDPPKWPHMVRWMGSWIQALEGPMRRIAGDNPAALITAGGLMWLIVAGGWTAIAAIVVWIAREIGAWAEAGVWIVIGFECLAAGQLWREGRGIVAALEAGDLELARKRLGRIVGRDTSVLDEAGISRAVIESLAENLNDAVIAPLFYLAAGGPVGAVLHKASSTMDSMVGYYNDRYRYLGRIPARMDDILAFIPARIAALIMVAGAWALGLDWKGAWRAMVRDHGLHRSPNAGWCEATAAGALGVRLGGPGVYWGRVHTRPWLNPEGTEPSAAHARAMLRLLGLCTALGGLAAAGLVWIIS